MTRACVLCCAAAGVLGLAVGCNSWTESKPDPKTTTVHRDEAVAGYKTKLDDLDKQLAALKDKADKAAGDEKPKLEAKHKEAVAKRDAFVKKSDELKAAPADKVDAAKKAGDAALAELKKAVE
jgi:hypothetical protein